MGVRLSGVHGDQTREGAQESDPVLRFPIAQSGGELWGWRGNIKYIYIPRSRKMGIPDVRGFGGESVCALGGITSHASARGGAGHISKEGHCWRTVTLFHFCRKWKTCTRGLRWVCDWKPRRVGTISICHVRGRDVSSRLIVGGGGGGGWRCRCRCRTLGSSGRL